MTGPPLLLDLFCGAGGAAEGYRQAGFTVIGVDVRQQFRYAGDRFVRTDAIVALELVLRRRNADGFAAIHASPPCQAYSTATKRNRTEHRHPDLIAPVRELLWAIGLPYVIENVVGAPLLDPELVCGTERLLEADGYRLRRHRMFELGFELLTPLPGCRCFGDPRPVMDVTGGGPTHAARTDGGGGRPFKGTAEQARRIMGMPWATKAELNEAVPPAYTKLIGERLLETLEQRRVA